MRDGRPESADLTVELRIGDPAWAAFFAAQRMDRAVFRMTLRFDLPRTEVRVMSRQHHVVALPDGRPGYGPVVVDRGHGPDSIDSERAVGRSWVWEDGGFQPEFGQDRRPAMDRLAGITTAHGWTWRPKLRG